MNRATAAEAAALRLHVASGCVWQTAGLDLARSTNLSPEAFLKSSARWERYDSVRLIGSHANAELISGLFGRIRVELISPQVCPSASMRRDPTMSLFYMRNSMLAPSQGGYHEMTEHEAAIYRATHVARSSKRIDDAISHLQRHPVWKAVNFFRGLNASFVASVMIMLLDPRWFVDTRFPDRSAKLTSFLGMDPKTQAGVLGLGPAQRKDNHCRIVMHSWYSKEIAVDVLTRYRQLKGLAPVAMAEEAGLSVRDGLWRVWADNYAKREKRPENAAVMATVRASQFFVNFLRLVWLSAIYRDSPSVSEPLFRPRDFFKSLAEANAYTDWLNTERWTRGQ